MSLPRLRRSLLPRIALLASLVAGAVTAAHADEGPIIGVLIASGSLDRRLEVNSERDSEFPVQADGSPDIQTFARRSSPESTDELEAPLIEHQTSDARSHLAGSED